MLFHWENKECTESNILFEKILGFDGNLFIKGPEKKVATYKLTAKNESTKVISNGHCVWSLHVPRSPTEIQKKKRNSI